MRILYGAVTMGEGHFARTCAIVPLLRQAGLDVDLVFSGSQSEGLKKGLAAIEPYRAFYGLTYVRREGRVSYVETVKAFKPFALRKDFKKIRGPYDLVISDFEPLTARWGMTNGVPVVGIAHQYAFWGKAPRAKVRDPLAEGIMRYYAPVNVPLGLHWRRTGPTTIPPVIRPEVLEARPRDGDHVLVYLASYSEKTLDRLFGHEALAPHRFVAYPKRTEYEPRSPNLTFKPFSAAGFAEDLASARAVVTAAGFTLLSECLHLGKAVYSIPEARQYEQQCNAEALRRWRLGQTARSFDARELASWLEKPWAVRRRFPNVVEAFAAWVAGGREEKPATFAARLWAGVGS